jgi:hypothetical protein
MKKFLFLLLLIMAGLSICSPAKADTVSCNDIADVYIDQCITCTPSGGDTNFNTKTRVLVSYHPTKGLARSLLRFDIPADISASQIQSATLYLSSSAHTGGSNVILTIACHALNAPFNEETDTWNSLGGGNFDAAVVSTGTLPAGNDWKTTVDVTALLTGNLDKVRTNGMLMKLAVEGPDKAYQSIASRECDDPSNPDYIEADEPPRLEITYSFPSSTTTTTVGPTTSSSTTSMLPTTTTTVQLTTSSITTSLLPTTTTTNPSTSTTSSVSSTSSSSTTTTTGGSNSSTTTSAVASTTSTIPGTTSTTSIPAVTTTTIPLPPPECNADADCDDEKFCNGAERCVLGQCLAEDSPCSEWQVCREELKQCLSMMSVSARCIPQRVLRPWLRDTRCFWLLVYCPVGTHVNSQSTIIITGPEIQAAGVKVNEQRQLVNMAGMLWVPMCIEADATTGAWKLSISTDADINGTMVNEVITADFTVR